MRIPLSAPDITGADIAAVTDVLRTSRLSLGPCLARFERAFAERTGVKEAVGVSSGTAGLHLAIRASGLTDGDEIITSAFGFVASVNAMLYERAVPVLVDAEPDGLNMDPGKVERAITPRTRAILAVHVFGRPADMNRLLSIARAYRLIVIEDACEALGATIDGRAAGTLGACGAFAFYPNKQITTGEGGMIVTDDSELAASCRRLRNHGRDSSSSWDAAGFGYNYRLTEMASALGLSQLERFDDTMARRADVARHYHQRLGGEPDLVLPEIDIPRVRTSWFVFVVRLGGGFRQEDRDWIVERMAQAGIECGRYFPSLHLLPHLARLGHRAGDFPVTEAAAARTIALPFFNRLRDHEIDDVCETLLGQLRARRDFTS